MLRASLLGRQGQRNSHYPESSTSVKCPPGPGDNSATATMRNLRRHLTFANIAAGFALVIALAGGTAYAANTVLSSDIVNGEVKSADVSDANGVRSVDVRDDTQTGGGLSAVDLTPDSVGTSEILADAVRGSEIATGVVGGDELENYHVHTGASVNVADPAERDGDWHAVTASAACGAGEQLVGHYAEWTSSGADEVATQEIIPDFATNSVTARGISDDGGTRTFRAAAVCVAG
jgi:hypothetical protein